MALRKRGKYWHIYWKENGKICSVSTGCTVKEEAQKFERLKMIELAQKRAQKKQSRITGTPPPKETIPVLPPQDHKRGSIRLDAMFDTALQYRKLSRTHKVIFDRFVRECGKTYADQITPKIALEYLRSKYGNGNGKSFNNSKTILNTIFRLCTIPLSPPSWRNEDVRRRRRLWRDKQVFFSRSDSRSSLKMRSLFRLGTA